MENIKAGRKAVEDLKEKIEHATKRNHAYALASYQVEMEQQVMSLYWTYQMLILGNVVDVMTRRISKPDPKSLNDFVTA